MNEDRVTLIISDLHVGGGAADPGDDHVCHRQQLVNFLREQAQSPEGRSGRLELFINGDFLEFAQTNTSAFSLVSERCWCTQDESAAKLQTIVKGHPEIFQALADFQRAGNVVTLAAGNHDVDLYWPRVQALLREAVGESLRFEIGQEWVERYGGLLQIGHGHMSDVANRFDNWARPVVTAQWGIECLEMCPGTLFMVKFVNRLEAQYPFADNLLPVTKLAWVLLRENKRSFAAVGWMFARFLATTSGTVLSASEADAFGHRLLGDVQNRRARRERLEAILRELGKTQEADSLAARSWSEAQLAEVMFFLLGRIDGAVWNELFTPEEEGVDLGADDITLSAIIQANFVDGKRQLREVARKRALLKGAAVVVMGHTHQEDSLQWDGGRYFNPGSWTRYLELDEHARVTLEDLRDESKYPYALNYVRVERSGASLKSTMVNIDRGGEPD